MNYDTGASVIFDDVEMEWIVEGLETDVELVEL